MKNWLLGIILAVVAIAPASLWIYYNTHRVAQEIAATPPKPTEPIDSNFVVIDFEPPNTSLEPGATFSVRSCRVIDGYRFLLYIDGERTISAHLTVATTDNAVSVVPDLLRKGAPPAPTVTLLRQVGGDWIVRLSIFQKGQRVDLLTLLREQKLLLE